MLFNHVGEPPLSDNHNAPTYPNLQSGAIQNVSALAPQIFEQCVTASSYTLAVGAFYPASYLTVATVLYGEPQINSSQAIVDDRDPRIVITGNWFLNSVSQEHNTSEHGTTSNGATAQSSFSGECFCNTNSQSELTFQIKGTSIAMSHRPCHR